MNDVNIYALFYKMAATIIPPGSTRQIMLKNLPPGQREAQTYYWPNMNEVSTVVEGDEVITQLIMNCHGTGLEPITNFHDDTVYLLMQYPILLP